MRRLRVLVVDDEPGVRRVTEAYLEVDGHSVMALCAADAVLAKPVTLAEHRAAIARVVGSD